MSSNVRTDREGHRATITLDRAEKKNALTMEMLEDVEAAVERLAAAGEIRVIVVTAVGDTFSGGADIDEFLARSESPLSEITYGFQETMHRVYHTIETVPVPVVSRVNGVAHGAGAELVLATDIRIAERSAGLAFGEIDLAVIPPFKRLSRDLSQTKVRELCYTGRTLTAEEAEDAGVFNRVEPAESIGRATDEIVDEIASKSPHALARTKQAMRYADTKAIQADIEYRRMVEYQCFSHPDFRESLEAFVENRQPDYTQ